MARSRLTNRQTTGRAGRNARAHYDIGNDLYLRMLGPEMVYSCARWDGANDLDAAQMAKMELTELTESMAQMDRMVLMGQMAKMDRTGPTAVRHRTPC